MFNGASFPCKNRGKLEVGHRILNFEFPNIKGLWAKRGRGGDTKKWTREKWELRGRGRGRGNYPPFRSREADFAKPKHFVIISPVAEGGGGGGGGRRAAPSSSSSSLFSGFLLREEG